MRILKVFSLLALLIVFSHSGFTMGDLRMMETSLIGQSAPDFTLNKTDGTKSALKEVRGEKKAIIFFWATWCPHCRTELQVLAGRAEELRSKNIEIIPVDIGEDKSKVVSYLKSKNIPWETFLDTEEEVANQYGVRGVPSLFFVASDGVIKEVRHNLPTNLETAF